MTDSCLLNYKIKESGFRFSFIAEKMNISRTSLYNKVNGKTEFYASEIQSLSEILKLDLDEKEKIFFKNKVDKKETRCWQLNSSQKRKEEIMGDLIYAGDYKRLEEKDYEECINNIFKVLKELPEDKRFLKSYKYCLEEVLNRLEYRQFSEL